MFENKKNLGHQLAATDFFRIQRDLYFFWRADFDWFSKNGSSLEICQDFSVQ